MINDGRQKPTTAERPKTLSQLYAVEEDPIKLDKRLHGPYPMIRVHTNGTVGICRQ